MVTRFQNLDEAFCILLLDNTFGNVTNTIMSTQYMDKYLGKLGSLNMLSRLREGKIKL